VTHDAETTAAAYLFGEMDPDEKQHFEEHLLTCEDCWREVERARVGMQALESSREFAPDHLRAKIRDVAREMPSSRRRRPARRPVAAAAVAVVLAGIAFGVWGMTRPPAVPAAITAAVTGYVDRRLPGSATPEAPAPDLPGLDLTEVGASAGRIERFDVNTYAFRDQSGRRLMIYIGDRAFPMPNDARPLEGSDGPWIAHHDGVAVLCARYPHELLIVGKDDKLVRAAAESLDVM
jgi:hypothetical protein